MKVKAALSLVVVYGPFLGFVGHAAENEQLSRVSKPLVAISGADSHVTKPSYERVTTPEDWNRIWASHLGTTIEDAYRPLLEVDFDRCLVVAIFRGEENQIRRIQIDSLSETGEAIVIRFMKLGYQIKASDLNKLHDRPYAFVVVPKSDKCIVLEERLQTKVGPSEWKECARLEGGRSLGR